MDHNLLASYNPKRWNISSTSLLCCRKIRVFYDILLISRDKSLVCNLNGWVRILYQYAKEMLNIRVWHTKLMVSCGYVIKNTCIFILVLISWYQEISLYLLNAFGIIKIKRLKSYAYGIEPTVLINGWVISYATQPNSSRAAGTIPKLWYLLYYSSRAASLC